MSDTFEQVLRKNGEKVPYLFIRNGSYYSLFRLGRKTIRRRCPYSTQGDAEKWINALRKELIEGVRSEQMYTQRIRSEYPTVERVCEAYLAMAAEKYAADESPSPRTARENVYKFKAILAEVHKVTDPGGLRLNESTINRTIPERFHAIRMDKDENPMEAKRRRITCASTLVGARSIFAGWTKWKYDAANIKFPETVLEFCQAVHSKKPAPYTRPEPESMIERTLKDGLELPPAQRAVFLLCYRFGMRRNEAQNARWSWVVPYAEGRGIRIDTTVNYKGAKNKKSRIVPGTIDTWELLDALRTESEFIVPGKTLKERKETIDACSKWMRSIGWNKETFSKTLHELRKLAGSIWCKKCGVQRAAQWLGDTMQVTMDFYIAVIGENAAVEM